MADDVVVDGEQYVSSKRAAELSGYAQDYIGQLCRGAQINARRIGGLWYVSMDSLNGYRSQPNAERTESQAHDDPRQIESLLTFDGKDYVSASRASEISGYNQDYVGQLAREGKIMSRQIGSRWYVEREGLIRHKEEKDALLATVQASAVGLKTGASTFPSSHLERGPEFQSTNNGPFTYTPEDFLQYTPLPSTKSLREHDSHVGKIEEDTRIHINIESTPVRRKTYVDRDVRVPGKARFLSKFLLFALLSLLIILASIAFIQGPKLAGTSGIAALERIGGALEKLIVPELIYIRT